MYVYEDGDNRVRVLSSSRRQLVKHRGTLTSYRGTVLICMPLSLITRKQICIKQQKSVTYINIARYVVIAGVLSYPPLSEKKHLGEEWNFQVYQARPLSTFMLPEEGSRRGDFPCPYFRLQRNTYNRLQYPLHTYVMQDSQDPPTQDTPLCSIHYVHQPRGHGLNLFVCADNVTIRHIKIQCISKMRQLH